MRTSIGTIEVNWAINIENAHIILDKKYIYKIRDNPYIFVIIIKNQNEWFNQMLVDPTSLHECNL